MADVKIPQNQPGIAGFATESYESAAEPRYGENVATTTHELCSTVAALTLPLYSVINVSPTGVISLAVYDANENTATAILAEPIAMLANTSMSVVMYREGHWDMQALNWHASFDTDAKKRNAFEGGPSPTLFVSKKLFSNSTIPA